MFDITFDKEAQVLAALALQSGVKYLYGWWMRHQREERFELVGSVSQLYLYPVKSCRGIALDEAECTPLGLRHAGVSDRHWMVVQPSGNFLSQRREPKMALISITPQGDVLQLEAPGKQPVTLPKDVVIDKRRVREYNVQGEAVQGLDCGDEVAKWVSDFLNYPDLRVVCYTDGLADRQFSHSLKAWPTTAVEGDQSAYSDWCTYMVASESSLEALNRQLQNPLTFRSFRPNIVVHGADAWDEDEWEELRIGENIRMRCLDACTRCRLTTVNPDTGVMSADGEPLKTLKRIRSIPMYDNEAAFGVNTAIDVCGEISAGDPVYAIRKLKK